MKKESSIEILPCWPENLPLGLVAVTEAHWLHPKGMTWNSYLTEHYLASEANPNPANRAPSNWFERIENCEARSTELLGKRGLESVAFSNAMQTETQTTLRGADELLSNVSCVKQSIQVFVRALHLIGSKGSGYDCSFSDPNIPFSIFISIPSLAEKHRLLRVLEAVVHESMHLQLSAWELTHRIVRTNSNEGTWYSPWKQTPRKLQGVLHGMYVFHVIAHVYSELLRRGVLSSSNKVFAESRLSEIGRELEQVRGVENSPALTDVGAQFAAAILNRMDEFFGSNLRRHRYANT